MALPFFFAIVLFSKVMPILSGILESACVSDYQCSVFHSECRRTYEQCSHGVCKCVHGYQQFMLSQCQKMLFLDEVCSNITERCVDGTVCMGSAPLQCKCPAHHTFHSHLQHCLPNNMTVLGGACSDVASCVTMGSVNNSVECTSTCSCKQGYIRSNFVCRLPMVGESCEASVGCRQIATSDPSVGKVSCSDSGQCSCQPRFEPQLTWLAGKRELACIASFSGGLLAPGAECTTSKQCITKTCMTCPDTVNKTCLHPTTGGSWRKDNSSVTVWTLVAALTIIVLN